MLLPKNYFGILPTFQLMESAGRSTDITRPLSELPDLPRRRLMPKLLARGKVLSLAGQFTTNVYPVRLEGRLPATEALAHARTAKRTGPNTTADQTGERGSRHPRMS